VRGSTIVMIAVAVVFGVLSMVMAQTWLSRQTDARMKNLQAQPTTVSTRKVVVAKSPLRFGNPLTAQSLREVEWPESAIPENTFSSIAELTSGDPRVVLASMEVNEPIVSTKLTGPGQRGTLSAIIGDGMKAVTIRVNDVDGVAGFVLPGDRVDVLMTRQKDETSSSDVVLQNVRVLGIDQLADERAEKPAIAKAVTLEVDTVSAQKIALAASAGNLSLVLRKAGDVVDEASRRITLMDIGTRSAGAPASAADNSFTTIRVIRASKNMEYSVPVEGAGRRTASDAQRGVARR
jgi:pilus assembly protein CpaB